MANRRPLILLEFNELCPKLLERFMAEGLLPNFRQLYEESAVFTTEADEGPPNLEPWIQWPTLHFGVPYSEHQIFHLGDGRAYPGEGIAKILSDSGVRVGVFGSMNLNYGPLNGYMIPDPWDKEGRTYPEWLLPFYRMVADQVQESSRAKSGSKADLARFGWFLFRNGLRMGTLRSILRQLWQERRDSGVRWRRASLLDQIQYDLARSLNLALGIEFATFFCNSTAHYQHYFWRNMEPEHFAVPPLETDHESLRDAVLFGYRSMDALVGEFLEDYSEWVIVLCTALSQQPWGDTTKCTYRPARFDELLDFAKIDVKSLAIKPVMAEEFTLECSSESAASEVERRLGSLTIQDRPLMKIERHCTKVFTGCGVMTFIDLETPIVRNPDGAVLRFGDLFYMVHGMRSGRHHPDGAFWIRTGTNRVFPDKVPLTCVAPTVLHHFGVSVPEAMLSPSVFDTGPARVALSN